MNKDNSPQEPRPSAAKLPVEIALVRIFDTSDGKILQEFLLGVTLAPSFEAKSNPTFEVVALREGQRLLARQLLLFGRKIGV